jgi:hypothetical protein
MGGDEHGSGESGNGKQQSFHRRSSSIDGWTHLGAGIPTNAYEEETVRG